MTVHFDDFHHLIRPHTGMCPAPIINKELRAAAHTFCETTRLWRETITQTLAANDADIAIPAYASLIQIGSVYLDGRKLEPMAFIDLPETATGSPKWFSQTEPGKLHVAPFVAGEAKISVYLRPRYGQSIGTGQGDQPYQDEYDRLPDFMLRDHGALLADGAIANILILPEQEWTNPQLAAIHAQRFQAGINKLAYSPLKHQVRAPIRTDTYWF